MQFSNDIFVRLAIFGLGIIGFFVARHIYTHKSNKKNPLICPVRFDCHTVVHSDYARLFNIPVEILGMFYYGIVSLSYLYLIFLPNTLPTLLVNFTIAMSFTAFIFSLYLIVVQIFVLKKGCSWCIVSAFICALIFFLTLATYHLSYIIGIFT